MRLLMLLFLGVFAGLLVFELGLLISQTLHQRLITNLKSDQFRAVMGLETQTSELKALITNKEREIDELIKTRDGLNSEITQLSQTAGLSTDRNGLHPFAVPTTGTVGSYVSTYLSVHNNVPHYGLDIWTNTSNGGAISTHRGNPVYSACNGKVVSFQPENGGVTIKCEAVTAGIQVPVLSVYTYYGHMGNSETKEQFIEVKQGQKVRRGEFIGYQGDLSMYTPGMRNVHLHFSIFTGPRERDGHQDPCQYIGGSCSEIGRFFVSDIK